MARVADCKQRRGTWGTRFRRFSSANCCAPCVQTYSLPVPYIPKVKQPSRCAMWNCNNTCSAAERHVAHGLPTRCAAESMCAGLTKVLCQGKHRATRGHARRRTNEDVRIIKGMRRVEAARYTGNQRVAAYFVPCDALRQPRTCQHSNVEAHWGQVGSSMQRTSWYPPWTSYRVVSLLTISFRSFRTACKGRKKKRKQQADGEWCSSGQKGCG